MNKPSRREFIHLSLTGGVLIAGLPLVNCVSGLSQSGGEGRFVPTPSNTLGPFYRPGAPRKEKLTEPNQAGIPLLVTGRVIDTAGVPVRNAVLEVFHADNEGEYDMSGFRCRGQIPIAENGEYRYETVMPGAYGGRAQHIHYRVSVPNQDGLITQLYFATDPKFAGDPARNYARDNLVEHPELIRPVNTISRDNVAFKAVTFDICLRRT